MITIEEAIAAAKEQRKLYVVECGEETAGEPNVLPGQDGYSSEISQHMCGKIWVATPLEVRIIKGPSYIRYSHQPWLLFSLQDAYLTLDEAMAALHEKMKGY